MIVNHADNGEIHSRYDDQSNHIEMTVMASGAMITLAFSQNNFNELVKTVRRLSEAFDEGRHERDVQRWIDWAEENRGSPKLKQYIRGKANELIDKQVEASIAASSGPWIKPRSFVEVATPINNGGAHDDPEYVFDDKDPEPIIKEDKVGRYGTMLDFGKPEDPGEPDVRIYAYSPENCPTKHYNPGDDFCADCGEDLNPPAPGIAPGSENVNVLQASRTEMLGIEHGFVRTRLEDDLTADEWQDIEDADEELAEFDGPVHLKRSFTLCEAGQLPKHMRRRIAAALARGEGSIVWHD